MDRPRVNLDPIARLLDEALEHPVARAVETIDPTALAGVRQLRANLPEVAAGVEAEAIAQLRGELQGIGQGMLDFVRASLERAATKRKRLPAPKRKARKRKGVRESA